MLENAVRMFVAAMAIAMAVLFPKTHGQGISWSGVAEGGVIQLQPGMTSTNLAITASVIDPVTPESLVFVLERQGKLILSITSAPPFSLTLTSLVQGKYFLSAGIGDLSFDIRAASLQPANDDWSRATILSNLGSAVTGSNLHATRELNDPEPGAGRSIWWAWTANTNGWVTATTAGSSFDTTLGVFVGASLAALTPLAANDDIGPNSFSQVTFSATKGATYYFIVDSATGSGGGLAQLRLVAGSPPSVSITSPADGYLALVKSSVVATNITAAISAADPAGIAGVDYWFDGGTNVSRSGSLSSPYQWGFTNLFAGHYILTVAASNHAGLVSVVNAGFSVISLEPVLVLDRSPGRFQMGLVGFKGPNYTLQASSNLDVWCGVNTWTNFAGAVKVADTNFAQLPQTFFRATSAQ